MTIMREDPAVQEDVPTTAMSDPVSTYSPNTRWGVHRVEIVLQAWEFRCVRVVQVNGNVRGHAVLDAAVDDLFESIENAAFMEADDGAGLVGLHLADPSGKRMWVADDEDRGAEWLKGLIVGVRIVGYDPPTLNEVRRMNGATPVPDGDVPHPSL